MAAIEIQETRRGAHRRRRRRVPPLWRGLVGIGLAALGLSVASPARAEENPQEKAAAEALFDEGRELIGQGQLEAACQRFEQSQAIDPGVGTLLYLGDCYERLGRYASAWAMYREASSSARAAGQAERGRVADERARRVAPGLSKLAVMVAAGNRIDGFELVINGRVLSAALFGASFPIDAGRYQLVARAPGRTEWTTLVDVKANGDQQLVQIPELELIPGLDTRPVPVGLVTVPTAGSTDAPESDATDSWLGLAPLQTAGVFVAAGGVVALGTGVVLGVIANGKEDEASERCEPSCLDRESADLNEEARNWATAANISYGVGVLALATGAVLYFSGAEEAPPSAAGLRVSPRLGLGSQSLFLEGTF